MKNDLDNNNFVYLLRKNFFLKTIICLILATLTLFTVYFCVNSKSSRSVKISLDSIEKDSLIIIEELKVNGNSYYGDNLLKEYQNDDDTYSFKEKTIEFECTQNDSFYIKINRENLKNSSVKIDDIEINSISNNESEYVEFSYEQSSFNILKAQIQSFAWYLSVIIIFISFFIYYIFVNFIQMFIKKLYKYDKLNIFEFLGSIFGIFIIYYMTFYTLLDLFSIFIVPILFLIFGFIIWTNNRDNKFELSKVFLIMSMFLGMTMLFVIEPFNVPDENNHFIKVYDHLFAIEKDNTIIDETGSAYTFLSENMYDFHEKYSSNTLKSNSAIDVKSYFEDYTLKVNKENSSSYGSYYGTYFTYRLAYIPANIMVWLSKILNFSVILTFLLGRFANLLCFALAGYYAIKITPKFKPVFFLVMTFAITFHQSIGINQDSINNCIFFLLTAFLIKHIFEDKIFDKIDILKILLLIMGLILCKTIYTPVILLLLLIDKNKMIKFKKPFLTKILLIIFVIILTVAFYYIKPYIYGFGGPSNRILYTPSILFTDPISVVKMYFNTLLNRSSLDFFRGLFDGFGWSTIWHKDLFIYFSIIIYALLIATLPSEKMEKILKIKFKLICLLIVVTLFGLISASMLFGWTQVGSNYIDGLQPRYFIPAVLFLYLFILNDIFNVNLKHYNRFLIASILLVNLLCFITIINGFYL